MLQVGGFNYVLDALKQKTTASSSATVRRRDGRAKYLFVHQSGTKTLDALEHWKVPASFSKVRFDRSERHKVVCESQVITIDWLSAAPPLDHTPAR